MKVRKEEIKVTKNILEMTDDELRMLAALADFPSWLRQTEKAREFLEELHEKAGGDTGFEFVTADEYFDMTPSKFA
ncbi:hypothetical protein E1264_03725 [Actinomadura sp. KC216]|uniref:hypothetical protein n=1 Tax=Actinomadura sp. KC216 TaxID=2530370 RepID=UPI00104EDFA7|nr:hypothetical protein [Actinomadura sp. KC216]TDB90927.1 hypothetical protein E1264_03725 [Actinomadura sp. KC216]